MTHTDYVQFFRNIAQWHLDIWSQNDDQFLNIDLFDDSAITSKPDSIKWKENKFALILEDFERGLSETNDDQQYWVYRGAFWVVATTGRDDKIKRADVKNAALDITTQIIAMMQFRSKMNYTPWLDGLVDGSFISQKIGPVWDNCFGWRTEFEIMEIANPDLILGNRWD